MQELKVESEPEVKAEPGPESEPDPEPGAGSEDAKEARRKNFLRRHQGSNPRLQGRNLKL